MRIVVGELSHAIICRLLSLQVVPALPPAAQQIRMVASINVPEVSNKIPSVDMECIDLLVRSYLLSARNAELPNRNAHPGITSSP